MTSFLDNLNQSQLPRAGGYLLTLAWAHIFYKLPFSSRHSPLFPISIPLFLSGCLSSPSISTSCLLERSRFFLRCASWDLFTAPALCHWAKSAKWDNLCTNTLHKAGTWMLPLFSLLPRNAKAENAFLSNGAFSVWEPVFVSISFSLSIFAETDKCSN